MIRKAVKDMLPEEIKKLAKFYCDNSLEHSYADNEEQLKEDVYYGWLDGFCTCAEGQVKMQSEKLCRHIRNLQKDKGKLIDNNRRARKIIRKLLSKEMHNPLEVLSIRTEAENFLKEKEL